MDDSLLTRLENSMHRRILALPECLRRYSNSIDTSARALMVTGPRGVGKTTFILSRLTGRRILYTSMDSPLVAKESLYEIASFAFSRGYEGIACDEVHYAKDWGVQLKSLHDDFPRQLVWASDSSSMVLRAGLADLSRRFVGVRLPLLSFREYVHLRTGAALPVLKRPRPDDYDAGAALRDQPLLELFRKYRSEGTRPIFSEGDYAERTLNLVEKTLYSDIPFFLPHVTEGNLRLMNAIVGGLAAASVPRLAVRSLCANWGIGAEKLYQLIFVMESVGLLRVIRPEHDRKARSIGSKLFFADAALYPILGGDAGTARESLVAAFFEESGRRIFAARDDSDFDFNDGEASYEVGGAGKAAKKADYVVRDDVDLPARKTMPLWMLGMMY